MTSQAETIASRQAIEDLMARYAHFGDRGFAGSGADTQALAALFTQDGVWESGDVVRFEGPEAIAAGLAASPVAFVVHMLLNPIITFDGDEASGLWKAILLLTGREGAGRWGVTRYEVRYRSTVEGWRIAHLRSGNIAWATGNFDVNA